MLQSIPFFYVSFLLLLFVSFYFQYSCDVSSHFLIQHTSFPVEIISDSFKSILLLRYCTLMEDIMLFLFYTWLGIHHNINLMGHKMYHPLRNIILLSFNTFTINSLTTLSLAGWTSKYKETKITAFQVNYNIILYIINIFYLFLHNPHG